MTVRSATHAGSWYSGNPARLDKQMDGFIQRAPHGSVDGARLLIGPHAGYTYAGEVLAQTYSAWDTSKVKRVFILGPSHHVYFKNVAYVSSCDEYETPLGNLPVDTELIDTLCKSHKVFKKMRLDVDEDEHSFEMHSPFIYKQTQHLPQGVPKIIPIMISHGDSTFNDQVAQALAPYLKDEENTFAISSDFCHWGRRFGYTVYTPDESLKGLKTISHTPQGEQAGELLIYQSIEFLDKLGMKVASTGSSENWDEYIDTTGNTICGQHPISLLLKTVELVREKYDKPQDWGLFNWIGYAQSSQVTTYNDSSVSYASGYAVTV